tara:strand:+ start:190 stop:432 length:243 start_codon:yes stop_codon:yes gene_type:complete
MMKNETANIDRGQIWFNLQTDEPIRITNIIPCTGVWGINAHDEGDCETISFNHIRKASGDEVLDFREDNRNFRNVTSIDL